MEQILSENFFAVFQTPSTGRLIGAITCGILICLALIVIGISNRTPFYVCLGCFIAAVFIGASLILGKESYPDTRYKTRILNCNKYEDVYKEDGTFDLKISNKEYNKILDGLKGNEERISVWGKDKDNKYMEINVVLDKNLIDKSTPKESEKILEIKKYKLDKKEVPFRFKDENSFFDEQYVITEIM